MDPRNARVPIIGQRVQDGPTAGGLTANCEIYDSEIGRIQSILETMRRKAEQQVDYGAWEREVIERLQDMGLKAVVNWYYTNVDGVRIPEITITDRLEKIDFDHNRQVHEVTNDILDLGDKGVIKFDPSQMQKHDHKH